MECEWFNTKRMRNVIKRKSCLCQLISSLKYITKCKKFSQKYHCQRRFFFLIIEEFFFYFFLLLLEEVYKTYGFTPVASSLAMLPVLYIPPTILIHPKAIDPLSFPSNVNKLVSDLLRHETLFSQAGHW